MSRCIWPWIELIAVIVGGVLIFGGLFACSYHNPNTPVRDHNPTYANVSSQVLVPYCIRCHKEFNEQANVEPMSEEICMALRGGAMPPSGARPSGALVDMVCRWGMNGN